MLEHDTGCPPCSHFCRVCGFIAHLIKLWVFYFLNPLHVSKPIVVMQFYSLHWVFTLEHFCTLFNGGWILDRLQVCHDTYCCQFQGLCPIFRFITFALLVNWTGHVQRLSVLLQFVCSVYRDVLLLKIAKIGFYTGELFSSVSMSKQMCGSMWAQLSWLHSTW